ncbi:hypothetical protein PMAYCL1PPCAC_32312, partial [Pristionchus mayeri]
DGRRRPVHGGAEAAGGGRAGAHARLRRLGRAEGRLSERALLDHTGVRGHRIRRCAEEDRVPMEHDLRELRPTPHDRQ